MVIPKREMIVIMNQHNFKGLRALLLLSRLLVVIGELIATFILMKQVTDFNAWISTSIAMTIIFVLLIDTILCLLYGCYISADMLSGSFMAGLLAGNPDYRARLSICIELTD